MAKITIFEKVILSDSNARHYLITKEHRGYVISGYQHAFHNLINLIEHFQCEFEKLIKINKLYKNRTYLVEW